MILNNFYHSKKINVRQLLFVLGLIVLIILSVFWVFRSYINNLLFSTVSYTSSNYNNIHDNIRDNFNNFLQNKNIVQSQKITIKKLNDEIIELKYHNRLLRALYEENKNLQYLLKIKQDKFPQAVSAQIISRSPASWNQEIIINKGSQNNIRPGMVAISQKGIVGQVQKIYNDYSIVKLISSSQVRFGGMLQRNSITGVIFGLNSQYALLKFVPIGSDVKIGDVIQTTSIKLNEQIDQIFPSTFPLGEVVQVSNTKNNSEMSILIRLYEDNSSSNDILILK